MNNNILKYTIMKKIILFVLLLSIVSLSQATIINVDNNANRPSGYQKNLQAAISNASAGDTIYVYLPTQHMELLLFQKNFISLDLDMMELPVLFLKLLLFIWIQLQLPHQILPALPSKALQ